MVGWLEDRRAGSWWWTASHNACIAGAGANACGLAATPSPTPPSLGLRCRAAALVAMLSLHRDKQR
jgi:hypothetical protein